MANPLVLTGLVVYLAVMLGVGLYAGRRVHNSTDFIVAGQRLPLLLCTATLAATWFGGGICIGAASAAYKGGILAVIADPFGAALCLFIAGLLYVRMMRRMGLMTIASFFSRRFGPRAGLLASLCTIPAYIGWVGSLLVAFGRILQSLTGIDPAFGICAAAVIVLIYTWAGGMWAVTLTDFIQVTILVLGLFILTPILLSDMGGWEALVTSIPASRFDFYPRGDAASWLVYARDWLVIGLGNLAGQDLIQRSLSSRDETVAYRSAYLAGLLYITVGLLPVFLGMAGAVVLPDLADPDLVMMALALEYLPDLALVLFMGGPRLGPPVQRRQRPPRSSECHWLGCPALLQTQCRGTVVAAPDALVRPPVGRGIFTVGPPHRFGVRLDGQFLVRAPRLAVRPANRWFVVAQEQRPWGLSFHSGRPVCLAGAGEDPSEFAGRPFGRAFFGPRLSNRQLANPKEGAAAALTRCGGPPFAL